jgi:hypothetical protein
MTEQELTQRAWWGYLMEDLQELLKESALLYEVSQTWDQKFHDYSFVVFPAAKAYEGFLKNVFLDLGFINDVAYYGKRFRVGKALNPELDTRYRKGSVYDQLVKFCQGRELPDQMWEVWKKGRNRTFHWFPNEKNAINLTEAGNILTELVDTMDMIFRGCKIDK